MDPNDPNDARLPFAEPSRPVVPPPLPADPVAPAPAPAVAAPPPPVTVTPTMVQHLKGTRPWVLTVGILSLAGGAFLVLLGLLVMLAGLFGGSELDPEMGPVPMVLVGFFYLIAAVVSLAIGALMIRYGVLIGRFLRVGGGDALERALGSQKAFWMAVGILSILYTVALVVFFVAAFIVGFLGALGGY